MTDEVAEKVNPRTTARAEAISSERRQRRSTTINRMGGMKLNIFDKSQLDLANYVYRWVTDEGNRLHEHYLADYDYVELSEIQNFHVEASTVNTESAGRLSNVVGTTSNGQQQRAYLMKKPRDWWEDDQNQNILKRQKMMEGVVRDGDVSSLGVDAKGIYAKENNKLGDAAKFVGERPQNRK